MSVSADKRGLKRVCVECGNRFYDLNKRPIVCPACSAEFSVEEKIKPRRAAAKKEDSGQVAEKKVEETSNDDELDEEDDGVEVVSLDDLETTDASGDDEDGDVNIDLDDDNLDDLNVDLDDDSGPDDELDNDLEKE